MRVFLAGDVDWLLCGPRGTEVCYRDSWTLEYQHFESRESVEQSAKVRVSSCENRARNRWKKRAVSESRVLVSILLAGDDLMRCNCLMMSKDSRRQIHRRPHG